MDCITYQNGFNDPHSLLSTNLITYIFPKDTEICDDSITYKKIDRKYETRFFFLVRFGNGKKLDPAGENDFDIGR